MRKFLGKWIVLAGLILIGVSGTVTAPQAQTAPAIAPTSSSPPYGIAFKRPVFAGACKACPWGVLAYVTAEAMEPMGYKLQICWVCWGSFGPREMADKTVPISPSPNPAAEYAEEPPPAVPDISATSMVNLVAAWNGTGAYAADNKKRQNYRIIAVVQQPNFLTIAINRKSGITDLSQVKDRTQPTWIAGNDKTVLDYYGITEEGLKAHGGGFVTTDDRLKRAAADIFIGGALLVDTPEQRMWYEVSQLDDLYFPDIPEALIQKELQSSDYTRGTIPLAMLRGVNRPIATVMREAHVIYVRDDAPDSFAYDVAKALDEHQERFRLHGDPFYYDPRLVGVSAVIPLHPGALKYYRERGYVK
jgi:TRAP-type uncharacterized transport system substrate-binding protein